MITKVIWTRTFCERWSFQKVNFSPNHLVLTNILNSDAAISMFSQCSVSQVVIGIIFCATFHCFHFAVTFILPFKPIQTTSYQLEFKSLLNTKIHIFLQIWILSETRKKYYFFNFIYSYYLFTVLSILKCIIFIKKS